jgi:plasmid stabilization system protein ParE
VKGLRIRLSESAIGDILEQADWYEEQADHQLSRRWERAVGTALLRIAKNPRSGALCKFKAEELGRVRWVLVAGFPKHLVFYQLHQNEVVILRVTHGARDLESLL